MKTLQLGFLLIVMNIMTISAQQFLTIQKDTVVLNKYQLNKNEIYKGAVVSFPKVTSALSSKGTPKPSSKITSAPTLKNCIIIGRDTIPYKHTTISSDTKDYTSQMFDIVKKVINTGYFIINIPFDKTQTEACKLYNSDNKLIRNFTLKYNEALIDTGKLKSWFKIVIPSTPVLIYFPEDKRKFSSYPPQSFKKNNYTVIVLNDSRKIAINKQDRKSASYVINESNLLSKIDPVEDSVIARNSGLVTFNEESQEWEILKTGAFNWTFFIILALAFLILLAAIWYFFIKKIPVYGIYDGGSFTNFASDYGSNRKFLFAENVEFRKQNMNNENEKAQMAMKLSGKYLIVGYKYVLTDFSKIKKSPVYLRFKGDPQNLSTISETIKIKDTHIQELNPNLEKIKTKDDTFDLKIGYIFQNQTPGSLAELLDSYEMKYRPDQNSREHVTRKEVSFNTDIEMDVLDREKKEKKETKENKVISVTTTRNDLPEFLSDFTNTFSENFNKLETRISLLENTIQRLDENLNQKNKNKSDLNLAFYNIESANVINSINKLQAAEKDLLSYVNSIKSVNVELLNFVHNCTNRFVSKQVVVKEKIVYWKPLLEACSNKLTLSPDDLLYKYLVEDLSQFNNEADKSVYIDRKLFNELWENYFSNLLIFCEELKNISTFLNHKTDKEQYTEIQNFSIKCMQSVTEISKTLDLSILYIPLFTLYENLNLKDLDIDIYTYFDYFYDQMKARLSKNYIVQILSYGIIAPKIDRSTKTKIKILP